MLTNWYWVKDSSTSWDEDEEEDEDDESHHDGFSTDCDNGNFKEKASLSISSLPNPRTVILPDFIIPQCLGASFPRTYIGCHCLSYFICMTYSASSCSQVHIFLSVFIPNSSSLPFLRKASSTFTKIKYLPCWNPSTVVINQQTILKWRILIWAWEPQIQCGNGP